MKSSFLEINANLFIPLSEIEFTFVRSSGPGGQNVNKVNSKAVLRWNLKKSPSFSEMLRDRMLLKLESKLTLDGDLILSSDSFRDQLRNREDCLDKLKALLADAVTIPKRRKKTKPSYSSTLRAKESKKRHSDKKKFRSGHD